MGANISTPSQGAADLQVADAPPAEDAALAMGVFMSEGLTELQSYPIGLNSSIASSYAQSEIRQDGLAALSYTSLATLSMRAAITANSIQEEGGPQGLFVSTSRQPSPRRSPGFSSYSPSSATRIARQLSQELDSPPISSTLLPVLTFSSPPRCDGPPVFMLTSQLDSAPITPSETPRATADGSITPTDFSPSPRRSGNGAALGGDPLDMSVVRSSISLTMPRGVVRSSISLTVPRPRPAVVAPSVDLAVAQLSLLLSSPRPSSAAASPRPLLVVGEDQPAGPVVDVSVGGCEGSTEVVCELESRGTDEVVADADEGVVQPEETGVATSTFEANPEEAIQTESMMEAEPEQSAFEFNPSPRASGVLAPSSDAPENSEAEQASSAAAPECGTMPCTETPSSPSASTSAPVEVDVDIMQPEVAAASVEPEVPTTSETLAVPLLSHLLLTSRQPDESAFEFVAASPHAPEDDAAAPPSESADAHITPAAADETQAVASPALQQQDRQALDENAGSASAHVPTPAAEVVASQDSDVSAPTATECEILDEPAAPASEAGVSAEPVGQASEEQCGAEAGDSLSALESADVIVEVQEVGTLTTPASEEGTAEEPHGAFQLLTLDWAAVNGGVDSGPTMISMGQARCDPPAHPLQESEWLSESEHDGLEASSVPIGAETETSVPRSDLDVHTAVAVLSDVEVKVVAQTSEDLAVARTQDQTVSLSAEAAESPTEGQVVTDSAQKVVEKLGSSGIQKAEKEVSTSRSTKRKPNAFLCCFSSSVEE